MIYKEVYKLNNGVLVRNTENKISYTDEYGKKRTVTNPTRRDFLKAGYKIKKYGEIPEYDPETEELCETVSDGGEFWEISFSVVKKIKKEEGYTDEKILNGYI